MRNQYINHSRRIGAAALLFFISVSAVFAGAWVPPELFAADTSEDPIKANMENLESLYRFIESKFLNEIDHEAVFDSMAKGLFAALDDPYSEYITAEESQDIQDLTKGFYGGIGAYISKPNPSYIDYSDPKTYMVTIVAPFLGSPAYKAGLHAGDLIAEIDDKKVDEYTVQESAAKLRGEPGTEVKLLVYRGSSSFTVVVTREIVEIPTVRYDMIGSIGYLQILEFTPLTPDKVKEATATFAAAGYRSMIMDLRSNPGGSVDSAVQIADLFLSAKTVLIMETGREKARSIYRTRTGVTVPADLPLVILTNAGTASSSEILAGALRDNGRSAVIIGETTFGKGLVQNVYPFGEGDYFKITASQYLTPSEASIHEVGIVPDLEIPEPELSEKELDAYSRLREAKLIREFVGVRDEFRDDEVDAFVRELQEEGYLLESRFLRKLIRNEFEVTMDFPPVYDLEYDLALQRAVEYLQSGE